MIASACLPSATRASPVARYCTFFFSGFEHAAIVAATASIDRTLNERLKFIEQPLNRRERHAPRLARAHLYWLNACGPLHKTHAGHPQSPREALLGFCE